MVGVGLRGGEGSGWGGKKGGRVRGSGGRGVNTINNTDTNDAKINANTN